MLNEVVHRPLRDADYFYDIKTDTNTTKTILTIAGLPNNGTSLDRFTAGNYVYKCSEVNGNTT